MRKALFLIAILPVFSQAITISDIPTIKNLSAQINTASSDLLIFSSYISNLADQNFVFSVGFSTDTISMTNQQKTNLINKYNVKKQTLQNLINQLP